MELSRRRSSNSDNLGGDWVEVAPLPAGVAVREVKDPDAPMLLLDPVAFWVLLGELKRRS
ncbi:DUF397 domain-containing protein [Actinomadura geliboluensis]|uniref:DUF397 domain-containing protein n=1 Tax=Actinomadura geliboluensis TaxID=882440 RepID=UPI00371281A6